MTFKPTRREAIVLSSKALLGLLAAFPSLHGCGTEPSTSMGSQVELEPEELILSWEGLLDKVRNLSQVQFSPSWEQESYVYDVAECMRALDLNDPAIAALFENYLNRHQNFPEINTVHHETAFEVSILTFEPGETISLHDHPEMTGVIMCHSGEIQVDNYNLLLEESQSGNHLIQRIGQEVMTAGSVATLTADRGNIHELKTSTFTRMIDIFTPPYDDISIAASRWYEKDSETYQGSTDIFEATSY